MDTLTKEKLETLVNFQGTNCVSIYIPTHSKGKEVNELKDAKVLKNHFQQIKNDIKASKNMAENEVIDYLKPISKLIEDNDFWRHQSEGLAIFLGKDFFEYYHLPYQVQELSLVTNGFHLVQLLPAYQVQQKYYVLAVSQGKVRLFVASQTEIEEINLPESVPDSASEALSYYDFEKSLQQHSGTATGRGNNPIYHGQGGDGSNDIAYLKEYFRHLDDVLHPILEDKERPVMLASVDFLHPIFRSANKSFNLHEKGLIGNFDKAQAKEIHKKSQELLSPQYEQLFENYKEKYQELAGTGKASYDIHDIAPAAVDGRIDTLFVVNGIHKWGYINKEDNSVVLRNEHLSNVRDLVNKSAVETVLNGGHTFFVEKDNLPEQLEEAEMAAVFRW